MDVVNLLKFMVVRIGYVPTPRRVFVYSEYVNPFPISTCSILIDCCAILQQSLATAFCWSCLIQVVHALFYSWFPDTIFFHTKLVFLPCVPADSVWCKATFFFLDWLDFSWQIIPVDQEARGGPHVYWIFRNIRRQYVKPEVCWPV